MRSTPDDDPEALYAEIEDLHGPGIAAVARRAVESPVPARPESRKARRGATGAKAGTTNHGRLSSGYHTSVAVKDGGID